VEAGARKVLRSFQQRDPKAEASDPAAPRVSDGVLSLFQR